MVISEWDADFADKSESHSDRLELKSVFCF